MWTLQSGNGISGVTVEFRRDTEGVNRAVTDDRGMARFAFTQPAPGIAPFFDDLKPGNPDPTGAIDVLGKPFADCVVVTYNQVPEFQNNTVAFAVVSDPHAGVITGLGPVEPLEGNAMALLATEGAPVAVLAVPLNLVVQPNAIVDTGRQGVARGGK